MRKGSDKEHNQIFSQIVLPFLLFLILVSLGGLYLFGGLPGSSPDVRSWADISVAVIFLPLLFIGPIILVFLVLTILLFRNLQLKVEKLFSKVSPAAKKVFRGATSLIEALIKPVIAIQSGFALLKNLFNPKRSFYGRKK